MNSTPVLPDWIRTANVAGYRTAHEVLRGYGLEETRLFGTESLYGDWSGDTLLLAKDFAPSRVIHKRVRAEITTSCDTGERLLCKKPWQRRPGSVGTCLSAIRGLGGSGGMTL